MRIRKVRILLLSSLLLLAVVAALVFLRSRSAPHAARLLPEADAVFYVDLRPIRLATGLGKTEDRPPRDLDYEQFIQATGFDFERDLREAAGAMHFPPAIPTGQTQPASQTKTRFSWILVGNVNHERLRAFFARNAVATDRYKKIEIYGIPRENRTVRVAILSADTVAVSNVDDAGVIQGMIDRYQKSAAPGGGPRLLREHYRDLPYLSIAWLIADLHNQSKSSPLNLGGWSIPFPNNSTLVASLRYRGDITLRAAALTASEESARDLTERLTTFLTLYRSIEANVDARGSDADVQEFFNSLAVEQEGKAAVLKATVTEGFLKNMFESASAPQPELADKPEKTQPKTPQRPRTKRKP